MILIESFNKRINYFGVELLVHSTIKYIATDASGLVKGYTECPQYKAHRWVTANGTTVYIGRVNLKFQPASSTLMEL